MRRIDYNIAANRAPHLPVFVISTLAVFIIGVLFLYSGIARISGTNHQLKEKVEQKRFYDRELAEIKKNEKMFDLQIDQIKKKWNQRVAFANQLIALKGYPYLKWLDHLEDILPDMVQLNEIYMDTRADGEVIMSISAYSSEKLYELYRSLIGHDLVISGESESNGMFRAKLKINLKK